MSATVGGHGRVIFSTTSDHACGRMQVSPQPKKGHAPALWRRFRSGFSKAGIGCTSALHSWRIIVRPCLQNKFFLVFCEVTDILHKYILVGGGVVG
jgi:hypothetical protein